MVDVLLVQPPIRDFYLTRKRTIPYGLACIAAVMEKMGILVDILDGLATAKSRVVEIPEEMAEIRGYYAGPDLSPFSLFHQFRHYGYSLEYIARRAGEADPFIVGVSSLFTAYSDTALETVRRIREACPGARIVVGGHHATSCPESVLSCDAVDYVLRGEGEVSLPRLVEALRNNTAVTDVPGVAFRKSDGSVFISPTAVMEKPDDYPMPSLHLLRNDYYARATGRTAVVMTSRGCPMRCTYCSMARGSDIPYRRRGELKVLSEIEAAVRDGARFIEFEDENLSLKRKPFVRLLEQLIERYGGLKLELRAMNGLYPPALDDATIRLMHRAGFRVLNLSLCTLSQRQLQRFRRADVNADFDRIVKAARELGMAVVGYIIVGAPAQDPAESVSDLVYLAQRPVVAGISVYYPAPGSFDFDLCSQKGLLPTSERLYRSSAIPISDTTSRLESITLLRLGRILNFMSYLNEHPEQAFNPSDSARNQRTQSGMVLLEQFFRDGLIRGVDSDGNSFVHQTAQKLTRTFIRRFIREGNQFGRWNRDILNRYITGLSNESEY